MKGRWHVLKTETWSYSGDDSSGVMDVILELGDVEGEDSAWLMKKVKFILVFSQTIRYRFSSIISQVTVSIKMYLKLLN